MKADMFKKIVETSEEGVWLIDAEGHTLYANAKMSTILGYSVAEMMKMNMFDFMGVSEKEYAIANLQKRKEGVREQHDFKFKRKDGNHVWTNISASPFYDENGKFAGALGMIKDIGHQRQTEALLKAQRSIFELLMNGAPLEEALNQLVVAIEGLVDNIIGSVLLVDEDETMLLKGSAHGLPVAYNEAIHQAPIGPRGGSCGTAAFTKKIVIVSDTQTDPLWTDYKDLAAKFNLRSCWSSPILARNGKTIGTFALYSHTIRIPTDFELQLVKDATAAAAVSIEHVRNRDKERINQQNAFFLAEARKTLTSSLDSKFNLQLILKLLVSHLADWCCLGLTDKDGEVQLATTATQRSEPGSDFIFEIPHCLQVALKDKKTSNLKKIDPAEIENIIGKENPSLMKLANEIGLAHALCVPMTLRGEIIGGIFLARTKRPFTEEELNLANELAFSCSLAVDNARLYQEAQLSNLTRDEFISVAAHELRTPLTILQGRLDLLKLMAEKKKFTKEVSDVIGPTLKTAHAQTTQFSKLIGNLLEVSKLGTMTLQLKKENVLLDKLILELVEKLKPEIEQKDCKVVLHLEPNISGHWDKTRLEQAIQNLISNAIKFSNGNKVEITAAKISPNVLIKVRDYGIGISPENQK